MGAAISAIYEEASAPDEQERQKARQGLEVLQKGSLLQINLRPNCTTKTQVPGIRALRMSRYSNIGIKGVPKGNISGAIDNYLGTARTGLSSETSLKGGFKKIISTALKEVPFTTDAGEPEDRLRFELTWIARWLWRWNFVRKGFSDKYENALGCRPYHLERVDR
ncbi:hypothetical protein F5Y05DRAFT_410694 [Hypoxylon sp. FL0543]|nr:hypothetical protein F5Y05DRAFT_410694 [Hypoxylon sp. FL0543]